MEKNCTKKNIPILIYSLIISALFLLVCTRSSPLYPINGWVDSNAFFTMGKGMMHGRVLYKDLFEQKGPLLYFIHGLSYLISNKTFFGVYIFEVIFFTILLFFSHKIINLYFKWQYSFIGLPLIAVTILNLQNFSYGDSAEEFTIPLIMIGLYYLLKYFSLEYPNKVISNKVLLFNGFLAGCIFWIKYSLIGFFFAWMMMIFLSLVIQKRFKIAFKSCIIFLLGMVIATIPWIIYFGYNHAIYSWINTYIFVNLNSYSVTLTPIQRLSFVLSETLGGLRTNILYGIFTALGTIYFILIPNRFLKSIFGRLAVVVCIFFTLLLQFVGGRGFLYYFLIAAPFMIFGVLLLCEILTHILTKNMEKKVVIIGIILILITFPLTFKYNHNAYMMKVKKSSLFQYRFAEIINKTPNATLLNYGSLDCGLYLTTGIVPNVRFFEDQNMSYAKFPENMNAQNDYLKEKKVDYVLTRELYGYGGTYTEAPYLKKNYHLIASQQQLFYGYNFKYRLYAKNGLKS